MPILAQTIPLYIGVPLAFLVLLLCAFVALLILRELKRGSETPAAPKPVEAPKAPTPVVPLIVVEKLADAIGKSVVAAVKANGGGVPTQNAAPAKAEPKPTFEPLPMAPMPQPKSKSAPEATSVIDPKTIAIFAAAAATVLQGKKHRIVGIRKPRISSGSAWTEQGRVAIHEKRHLERN